MTEVNQDKNLYNFLNGIRLDNYTEPEEKGFHTTGNIGAILNTDTALLKNVKNGILFNPVNYTINGNNEQKTPLLYCDKPQLSSLLPYYSNGIPNIVLKPSCNMTLDGVASPTLAGISTAFLNNSEILNNSNNNIGYEVDAYGFANENGSRALGQGYNSCNKLLSGFGVPLLSLEQNQNGAYIATPKTFNSSVPLYQVGNWTDPNLAGPNFLSDFNNNVGSGCIPRPTPSGAPLNIH